MVLPDPSKTLVNLESRAREDDAARAQAVALRAERIRMLIAAAGRDDVVSIAIQVAGDDRSEAWAAWPVSAHVRRGPALRAATAANSETWRPLVAECRAVAALTPGDQRRRLLLLDLEQGRVR